MKIAETPGDRLWLIRLACGDGFRKPEPLPLFAARVKRETGVDYHQASLSLLERMKQGWRLDDIRTLAAVDPKGRGPIWLAFGVDEASAMPDPTLDRGLTPAEEERAIAVAKRASASPRKRPKKADGESAG